jgi:CRISPR-associated protein Csx3
MEYLKNDFISFEVKDIGKGITSIHFELKRQLEPQDLKNIRPLDPVKNKFSKNIVVLSGGAPICLYGFLVHFFHPVKAIAFFTQD